MAWYRETIDDENANEHMDRNRQLMLDRCDWVDDKTAQMHLS